MGCQNDTTITSVSRVGCDSLVPEESPIFLFLFLLLYYQISELKRTRALYKSASSSSVGCDSLVPEESPIFLFLYYFVLFCITVSDIRATVKRTRFV
jgi:hypothetical protein